MTDKNEQHDQALEQKIADAMYMSKPEAENATVLRDATGRWVLEIYGAGHSVEGAPTAKTNE